MLQFSHPTLPTRSLLGGFRVFVAILALTCRRRHTYMINSGMIFLNSGGDHVFFYTEVAIYYTIIYYIYIYTYICEREGKRGDPHVSSSENGT